MELELSRVDYTFVGLTSTNCMKALPPTFLKEPQKIAVIDNDGILQVFSIKKEDISLVFKTLPGGKATSLQLGGENGALSDRLFAAFEHEVRGYTKKGKLFLTFDLSMTEAISSMCILGNDLFLCGKHVYNHYRDCKEMGSYLCGDTILDVIALFQESTGRLISLIACEGRMIRAIEHGRLTMSLEIPSPPSILFIYDVDNEKTILFGCTDGNIGIIDLERQQFKRWIIEGKNAVSCLDAYDFLGDGNKNLVVGRQDGSIEVYVINVKNDLDPSTLIFSYNCNECVTAIQCGIFTAHTFDEILVATYTGRIFGLTTEKIEKNVEKSDNGENLIYSVDTSQKIIKLGNEIEDLQHKITKEREKYQMSTQFFDELSAIPLLDVKDSFLLSQETSTYNLVIEVPTAIDNVLLQSNVHLELLDVEKNSAVISSSEGGTNINGNILVTYRCQINTNRLEIKIRTFEGQSGIFQAYVTPMVQPKCSRLRKYDIKPLSLHCRVHTFPKNGIYSCLTIKGNFSLAEIHSWINQCLPEVPEKPQITDQNILNFKSTFLDTVLQCEYLKGEAVFLSNNVSTISIIKEFLAKEATKRKIKIEFNVEIKDDNINDVVKIIEPKLLKEQKYNNEIKILNALMELEVTDNEVENSLCDKYRNLLSNEKELRSDNNQPGYLERLYGVIADLYVDYYKLKGSNMKSKLPTLIKILDNFSHNELLYFFRPELKEAE